MAKRREITYTAKFYTSDGKELTKEEFNQAIYKILDKKYKKDKPKTA